MPVTCEESACRCVVESGDRFCSDACRQRSEDASTPGVPCTCQHVACQADSEDRGKGVAARPGSVR
jgi:hypothetical protein